MDERIKELWTQAEEQRVDSNGKIWVNTVSKTRRKFTELIIRECADLFEIEWGEGKLTGNDVGHILKKHFGVE